MKPTYLNLLAALVLSLFIVSCESEIEFNGDDTASMMVLHSILTPDSVIKAHITKSKFFLRDDSSFDPVTDAEVNVYVNNVFAEKLTARGKGVYTGSYRPQPGDTVKITARNNSLGEVRSLTEISHPNPVISVDTSFINLNEFPLTGFSNIPGQFGEDTIGKIINKKINFTVNFNDPDVKNFYRLSVKTRLYFSTGEIRESMSWFQSDDLVFGSNDEGSLFDSNSNSYYHEFSDELFNGKKYGLKFNLTASETIYRPGKEPRKNGENDLYLPIKQEVIINLQSISKSYFLYLRSRAANNSYVEYFSEPVQIHNNIENGIGLVGSATNSRYTFNLPIRYRLDSYYYGSY